VAVKGNTLVNGKGTGIYLGPGGKLTLKSDVRLSDDIFLHDGDTVLVSGDLSGGLEVAQDTLPAGKIARITLDDSSALLGRKVLEGTAGNNDKFVITNNGAYNINSEGCIGGTGPFVPVTNITGVPSEATAGTDLALSGTVAPANATNQAIIWSVPSAGTTGASIVEGNKLRTTSEGTATVTATIINGASETTNYTQDFDIAVIPALGGSVSITGGSGPSGEPMISDSLTADISGITNKVRSPAYQWKRDGTTPVSTIATYIVVAEDVGHTFTVTVTYANGSLTSDPTAAVLALAYTYTAPSPGSAVNGVSISSIAFSPASPQPAGTSVTATVNFSGSAGVAGIFTINLSSAKAGLTGAARTLVIAAGGTPTAQTFTFTMPAQNVDDFVLSFSFLAANRANGSIKNTFGIGATGAAGVTATFNAVHAYVSNITADQLAADGIIQLGDYIDLPSITLDGLVITDAPITPIRPPYDGYEGRVLRLLVVGINSFNAAPHIEYGHFPGDDPIYYSGNGNGTDAHLVFQFQNMQTQSYSYETSYMSDMGFVRFMNDTKTNAGGYGASKLRGWLKNNFLSGLIAAGVPKGVLWAPRRYVANGGSGATAADLIEDLLWVPTEREMFGPPVWDNNGPVWTSIGNMFTYFSNHEYETAENQTHLEYYPHYPGQLGDAMRIKFNSLGDRVIYWLASPFVDIWNYGNGSYVNYFNIVSSDGYQTLIEADYHRVYVAPAFCVK
jgi:hypothetical protein